jgi:hypothetical protein
MWGFFRFRSKLLSAMQHLKCFQKIT